MKKPILCLDFDGVIHSYTSGWQGAHVVPDLPVPGALSFLEEATETFEVHIYSSRSHQAGGIDAMQSWLNRVAHAKYGKLPLWVALIKWPTKKPSALVTIDDRAICFDGTWPSMLSLKSFKPWNKQ